MAKISVVILDAIRMTRELGEQYLWVDSLCVVQDDASIKHRQLALMAEIYISATATLIACSGTDANARLCSPNTSRFFGEALWYDRSYNFSNQSPVFLLRPLDTSPFLDQITPSYHNQRGSTFQERLLCRRRLFFLEDKIIFHCRRDMFSEDGEVDVKIVSDYLKMPADLAGTFHYYDDAVGFHRGHGSEWSSGMTSTSWDIGFRFWSSVVKNSGRSSLPSMGIF